MTITDENFTATTGKPVGLVCGCGFFSLGGRRSKGGRGVRHTVTVHHDKSIQISHSA